jgi:predicted secreted protein
MFMKSLCFSMGGLVRKSEFSSTSSAILQLASVEETQDIQRQFNCYRNILLPLDAPLSTLFATTVQTIIFVFRTQYRMAYELNRIEDIHDAALVFIFKYRMKFSNM